jgi:hypothetical protein
MSDFPCWKGIMNTIHKLFSLSLSFRWHWPEQCIPGIFCWTWWKSVQLHKWLLSWWIHIPVWIRTPSSIHLVATTFRWFSTSSFYSVKWLFHLFPDVADTRQMWTCVVFKLFFISFRYRKYKWAKCEFSFSSLFSKLLWCDCP